MKMLTNLCIVFAVLFTAGCGPRKTASPTVENRIILASFYPMYVTALNVANGVPGVIVKNMTKPQTGCLHDYQMTPDDMQTISKAWCFVVNGGGMESFLDKVTAHYPSMKIIPASTGIPLMTGDGEEGDNPHVWVSVSNSIVQVNNVCKGLCEADPEHAALYQTNAATYVKKLEALRTRMHEGLANIASRNIITFHEAFPYFAQEFGLTIAAVIEREPGSEPSAGELAETVDIVRKNTVKALFAEPQYPARAAETIARETGAHLHTLDPAVSGPDSPDAYIQIMDENLRVLMEALK